ncbi:hypothetical protein ACQ86K_27670 [Mucilaginibacter sp. P19]|uniref:hypothetical protein n=1 Tax=Mucilaginibacter sp. P19 TaxID=3423947 RepID=UPI003D66EE9A
MDEKQLLPVSFSKAFKKYFKNIITDGDHHEIKEDNFTIDYFDDGEPSSTLMLNLYGESAIYPLIDLAIKNNWQIFDTGLGDMIDLNKPSANGYLNFEAYRIQVLNSSAPKKQNWFGQLFKRKT